MLEQFQRTRGIRRENRTIAGRARGGKLVPIMAVPFKENEGGTVNQTVAVELDPIAGRLLTEVNAHVVSVFVPMLAMHAIRYPDDNGGNREIYRDNLLSGNPVFSVDGEHELSQSMGIVPRSENGVKRVSETVRHAHNAAVNFLRQRVYVDAEKVPALNTAITPALLSSTVLQRMNGVLDPEDRVNGAVHLEGEIPVRGIGFWHQDKGTRQPRWVQETGDAPGTHTQRLAILHDKYDRDNTGEATIAIRATEDDYPNITAVFGNEQALSLNQFFQAERMDRLTREMRRVLDENPEYGEDILVKMAHGLNVESGKVPFVVYEREGPLQKVMTSAMDGPSLGTEITELRGEMEFTVPIPKSEFGGILVTFLSVKPDETLPSQPHPILSKTWKAHNHAADELAIDPVPVTFRDLNADVAQGQEGQVAFFVGNNHLYRNYVNYGFTRNTDLTTVEHQAAMWQLEIPLSVNPQSVIYPQTISHAPFADANADVVQWTSSVSAVISTPIIFGEIPVEEMPIIETENLFEDE